MTSEDITYEMRTLHERVLACERCNIRLVPSDRGWRCTFPFHPGIDSDQAAAERLRKLASCDLEKARQTVARYRLFAAKKSVSDREAVFARPASTN